MIIDCNNKQQILEILADKEYITFFRGSRLYKTYDEKSDFDFGVLIPDGNEIIDITETNESEKADKRLHNCAVITLPNTSGGASNIDVQLVMRADFVDMIKECTPFALEAIFSIGDRIKVYREYLTELDKWKLRESFCAIANNSWAKAHKKMTVEKDLDMYCGAKSLFHSIRLQKFACQIAKINSIEDELNFTECKDLWTEIKADLDAGKDWDFFNEKYKPIYNEAHSELVKLCPKPAENYKKPRKKKGKKDEQ